MAGKLSGSAIQANTITATQLSSQLGPVTSELQLVGSGVSLNVSNTAVFTGNVGIGTVNPEHKLQINGDVRVSGTLAAGFDTSGLFFRNRIINGDMKISQVLNGANTNVPVVGAVYPVDRFSVNRANGYANDAGAERSTDAPPGFTYSLKYTSGTAETVTGAMYSNIQQYVEGQNVSDLGWGSSEALSATLSFWIKISITGTFGVVVRAGDASRSYGVSFSYNSANTWQFVSFVIPGPTSGGTTAFTKDNGWAFSVNWDLGVGPNLSISTGSWLSNNALGITGTTKLNETTGATYFLTGVQLEAGSVSTPFERKPFTTELQLCQRYCYVIRSGAIAATTVGVGWWDSAAGNRSLCVFPTTMRATPTLIFSAAGDLEALQVNVNWNQCSAAALTSETSVYSAQLSCTSSGGGTANSSALRVASGNTKYIGFIADI
jgi:hypothetical protein